MPFYEYECASCKFYTELMQKLSDPPLKKCPSCGKSTMKKLISAPVFRLKGGGWYETDFKSDKENKRNLAGADEAPEAKPASTPAADAKPAESKSESKPAENASSSAAKSAKSGKPAAKPVTKAPARKPAAKPKAKAKVSKRRGR